MDNYLKDFLKIIRNCSFDNTYKMAWAKALVELSSENPKKEKILLEELSKKIFKYYWNQTIYFDLIQGSNLSKPPEIITLVKTEIERYYSIIGTRKPVHFERIESTINIDTAKVVKILKQDVSWRFLNLKNETIPIYDYELKSDFLMLRKPHLIAEYSDVLLDSINFKWVQMVESYDSSPRIAKKVRVLDMKELKRSSLSKFRKPLDLINPNHICFICHQKIVDETPSIDHVIPWSFIFNDDLWNLVYSHKSCNSQKSNIIPSESEITQLEKRNRQLLNLIKTNEDKYKTMKIYKALSLAIEKDYVRKFWVNCKN